MCRRWRRKDRRSGPAEIPEVMWGTSAVARCTARRLGVVRATPAGAADVRARRANLGPSSTFNSNFSLQELEAFINDQACHPNGVLDFPEFLDVLSRLICDSLDVAVRPEDPKPQRLCLCAMCQCDSRLGSLGSLRCRAWKCRRTHGNARARAHGGRGPPWLQPLLVRIFKRPQRAHMQNPRARSIQNLCGRACAAGHRRSGHATNV